jgi:hypothetical protein
MFIKELDVTIINPLGNLFSNLMRRPTFNHIESCPSILRLSSRTRADEQVV